MEQAPLANAAAFFRPRSLIAWLAVSSAFAYRFNWLPSRSHVQAVLHGTTGRWTAGEWLRLIVELTRPLPVFALLAIAFIACFEMLHRRTFDRAMRHAIGAEDMRSLAAYYNLPGATGTKPAGRTGFMVIEYDGRIIGCAGLDGRKPGERLGGVDEAEVEAGAPVEAARDGLRKRKTVQTNGDARAPATCELRHLTCSLSFRETGIEGDLLDYILRFAFAPSTTDVGDGLPSATVPPAQRIEILLRPALQRSLAATLAARGFRRDRTEPVDDSMAPSAAELKTGVAARLEPFIAAFSSLDLRRHRFVLVRS